MTELEKTLDALNIDDMIACVRAATEDFPDLLARRQVQEAKHDSDHSDHDVEDMDMDMEPQPEMVAAQPEPQPQPQPVEAKAYSAEEWEQMHRQLHIDLHPSQQVLTAETACDVAVDTPLHCSGLTGNREQCTLPTADPGYAFVANVEGQGVKVKFNGTIQGHIQPYHTVSKTLWAESTQSQPRTSGRRRVQKSIDDSDEDEEHY
jgi:hypothetical protein